MKSNLFFLHFELGCKICVSVVIFISNFECLPTNLHKIWEIQVCHKSNFVTVIKVIYINIFVYDTVTSFSRKRCLLIFPPYVLCCCERDKRHTDLRFAGFQQDYFEEKRTGLKKKKKKKFTLGQGKLQDLQA